MSNYFRLPGSAIAYESENPEGIEVRCPAHCDGGLVEVDGYETDCITCEGLGTIIVSR